MVVELYAWLISALIGSQIVMIVRYRQMRRRVVALEVIVDNIVDDLLEYPHDEKEN